MESTLQPDDDGQAVGEPLFVGIDLAWSARNTSGVALIRGSRLIAHCGTLTDDTSILAFLAPHLDELGPAVFAVDAPLRVPNLTGARPCDRALTADWSRFHAGALPANRRLLANDNVVRGEALAAVLSRRFACRQTLPIPHLSAQRLICEVYPHPALVSLFDLDRVLKYKARKGRSLAMRRSEFRRYQRYLISLREYEPPLLGADTLLMEDVAHLRGKTLQAYEETLDALICAYVAAYSWHHGPGRTKVYGDLATGHILVPMTTAMAQRLARGGD